MLSMLLPLVTD